MGTNAHWTQRYIGLPYAQADCAALCVKVQREVFGKNINLPTDRAENLQGLSKQITDYQADYATPTPLPEEGDAVLMIGRGKLCHIGIATFIKGQLWVLHAMRSAKQTVLHKAIALDNVGLSIEGYYQWK